VNENWIISVSLSMRLL